MKTLYDVFHFRNAKISGSFGMETCIIDYYDLTMVTYGDLSYIVNGEHIVLKAGDVMLLPPGTQRARIELSDAVHYISFNFYTDETIDLPFLMHDAVTNEILSLFKAFTPHHLSGEKRAREKASNIVGYILEVLIIANQQASQNIHVLKAIDYINTHLSEAISLSDLAAFLHLSREYTANLFKKETGMTVSSFINEQKLARACDLLRDKEKSLVDIANSLGYETYGYFSRIFKKRFGVSPAKFV